MNLDHLQAIALIQKIAWTLSDNGHDFKAVEVCVLPPFTALRSAQTLIEAENFEVSLGAQDISQYASGAHTGEVAGQMLSKLGVKYVLVGHSERRQQQGENDELVRKKVAACFTNNLIPIICVGETQQELEWRDNAVPVEQTLAAISDHGKLREFVIAYEPVWAIGTGAVATAEHAAGVAGAIRSAIGKRSPELAAGTRILYGGSVKTHNVAGFMRMPEIDGVLVGGASLAAEEFSNIARYKKHLVL
jgi:triosephosphate isomerase